MERRLQRFLELSSCQEQFPDSLQELRSLARWLSRETRLQALEEALCTGDLAETQGLLEPLGAPPVPASGPAWLGPAIPQESGALPRGGGTWKGVPFVSALGLPGLSVMGRLL